MKSPTTNLFGGNTNGANDANKQKDSPSTVFGFKLASSTTITPVIANDSPSTRPPPNQTSTPITETAQKPEGDTPQKSVFGSSSGISFADLAKNNGDKSEPFSTSNTVSFATLAQNSSNGSSTFGKASSTGGFFGLSNKDTFSNLMAPQNTLNGTNGQNSTSNNDDNENLTEDANYDPHYDPIIELPDEIQVSTGEENEEKLFSERAKLYRFDSVNKEVNFEYFNCFQIF